MFHILPLDPESGKNLFLTTEIEGVSGSSAYVYHSYFGDSSPSSSGTFLGSLGGGKYSTQLYVSPENGEEVSCFVIAWDDSGNPILSNEHIIQIGHVERSDITTLEISNVTHGTPPNAGTSTNAEVYADIQTDAPPVDAKIIPFYYRKNHVYGMCRWSEEMTLQTENTYKGKFPPSFTGENWPSNAIVMYKIVAKDNMGNTAVSKWENFTIS